MLSSLSLQSNAHLSHPTFTSPIQRSPLPSNAHLSHPMLTSPIQCSPLPSNAHLSHPMLTSPIQCSPLPSNSAHRPHPLFRPHNLRMSTNLSSKMVMLWIRCRQENLCPAQLFSQTLHFALSLLPSLFPPSPLPTPIPAIPRVSSG